MYNINWDNINKIWHIMVISNIDTEVPSCDRKGYHADWIGGTLTGFPHGKFLKNSALHYPNPIELNLSNICTACIKKEISNMEDFKSWLIVQKLKYL